ncbi:MAG TPA: sulfite exporter TauE/SafE family protein [Candidatus Sulfotelmatobacter sp.]|nr:sulfite exporter TauE/SafE family protein [Candidatus Sulfotelmatobacter sp.]
MLWGAAALGLFVGFLIGLTGMGGGAMMTPLLLWTGWIAPTVAVGTDLVWNALTKTVGAAVHYRHRNVNLRLVGRLAMGSVPGALFGLFLLGLLKRSAGVVFVDHLIVRLLGGTLIVVAVAILCKTYFRRWLPAQALRTADEETLKGWQVPLLGFIVGVLVSFTSVGSGSLIVTTLLLLFPGERLNKLVGSDVVHGVIIVGVAALGHWRMGDVNVPLVTGLLLGSIPGVSIGSYLASRIPEGTLRPAVATLLFVTGVKLI